MRDIGILFWLLPLALRSAELTAPVRHEKELPVAALPHFFAQ